jgi:Xaa-Pro aminopeptidase
MLVLARLARLWYEEGDMHPGDSTGKRRTHPDDGEGGIVAIRAQTGHDGSWVLPFPAAEYEQQLTKVREEMAQRGLDLLCVTSSPNLYYLLGHASVWFDGRNPTGVAIPLDAALAPVLFDTWDHEPNWPATVRDGVTYGEQGFYYPSSLDVIAAELKARGWLGRGGLEEWSWAPAGPVLRELADRIRAAGAGEVVDGSFAVDHVRLIKSPAELACTRRALEIADTALSAVAAALAPGVSEKELMGIMYHEVGRLGGDEPGIRMMVHSGLDSNHFHAPASERRIVAGELLQIDMSAAYCHYHGNTARAFSIGEDRFWQDAYAKLPAIRDATVAQIRPGDPTMKLQRLMDEQIDAAGLRDLVWWVGGYVLGISMPPDWVGHVYLNDEEGFEPGVFEPGFVANWEIQLEDVPGHQGVGLIDTMIMTETGIEIPARRPAAITVV